jgi:hypothetical protein
VRGEPAGDDNRSKLVVEAAVFSFGHAANPSAATMQSAQRDEGRRAF